MKRTVLVLTFAAIAAATSASAAVLTKSQADYFKNRRICVKRDTTTMPGYVITHWHRNGKPDTKGPAVITNRLQKIVGSEQKNHIQDLAERMKQSAEAWRTSATNNAARVERVTAALDDIRAESVEKRDAAVMPSTKAIYQAFIDAIDRLKEKLNAEGN